MRVSAVVHPTVISMVSGFVLCAGIAPAAEPPVPRIRTIAECQICRSMGVDFRRSLHQAIQNPNSCTSIITGYRFECGPFDVDTCCALYKAVLNDWANGKLDCADEKYRTCSTDYEACEKTYTVDCEFMSYPEYVERTEAARGNCVESFEPCQQPYQKSCLEALIYGDEDTWGCGGDPLDRPYDSPPQYCTLICTQHPTTKKQLIGCGCTTQILPRP